MSRAPLPDTPPVAYSLPARRRGQLCRDEVPGITLDGVALVLWVERLSPGVIALESAKVCRCHTVRCLWHMISGFASGMHIQLCPKCLYLRVL